MKKRVNLLLVLLLGIIRAFAQNEQNIWAFGDKAGLDFSSGIPVPVTNNLSQGYEGTASICDGSGQLLFYTNGCWVWNRAHEIMPELTGGVSGVVNPVYPTAYPPMMPYSGSWATQSAAITAVPAHKGLYYIFSLSSSGQLYYSQIDMSLNSGKGGIVSGKKGIPLSGGLMEKLTVVKGCNNIWVLVRSKTANQYRAFEINDTGIVTNPVVSPVGHLPLSWYRCGVIKFSPDGSVVAAACNDPYTLSGGLELYDFDTRTGMLTNARVLDSSRTLGYYYGACFSADGSKLYASTSSFGIGTVMHYGKVRQFDLSLGSLAAVIASNTIVFTDMVNQLDNMGDLKRGKDGKIYFGSGKPAAPYVPYMHRIDAPNAAGTGCAVVPYALAMPGGLWSERGLPNDIALAPAPDTTGTTRIVPVCFRDSVRISADSGRHYLWSDGSRSRSITVSHDGSYLVRYINLNCAYAIDTYRVVFYHVPKTGTNGFSCIGQKQGVAWCGALSADTATVRYIWKNAAGLTLQQHFSALGDTIKGLDTGAYSVRVISPGGCDTTLFVRIGALPVPIVTVSADTNGCLGVPLSFSGSTDAPVWKWIFEKGYTSGQLSVWRTYTDTGSFVAAFTATSIEGCSDTAILHIAIRSFDLHLVADKELVNQNEWVTLQTSAAEPYTVLSWLPSGLITDPTAKAQALSLDTTQTIIVIGRSELSGCIGTDSIMIAVTPSVLTPNAFTPNGDGLNDRFRPVASGYIFVRQFEVYNRYGQMVYAASGSHIDGWDGTFNGKPMELGTYYYLINIETAENKTIMLKGDVILIR
ncbi:gliding motility-associated C-terminal domain-containing protein [Rurimicrobium arvi]|uniref:PKD domain-containing protein n=1 Tax=Rurimicrobium arvi TaxID=2049916 RepID=A0ABP8MY66_9BACT